MAKDKIFQMQKPRNRLIGAMPKIGIRPTIDGRLGGVRESLEEQIMNMAKAVAKLLESELKHANGLPVECVIADSTIGGVAEAAKCEAKFERTGVEVSLTVTTAWCYGSETMDMHPTRPKAVWGFNGTERPGAVYLAAVMAAHAQKGLPAFSIYGQDVQDSDDGSIPEDVKIKLLQFAKAGLAMARMKNKSYLSVGGISMGIMGSYVVHDFFEDYFGMRVEDIDMSEISRRVEAQIYDKKEYKKALKWTKDYCKEGKDYNPKEFKQNRKEQDQAWEYSVKMALIMRDLMVGNPELAKAGFGEEALGHNALVAGFQGQRQWTDFKPNGDFMEAILNTSFDWNGIRQPYMVATENDALNGMSMLFGHLLTGTAQIFADVRTFWSPEAVKRVSGYKLKGKASGGFLHLINSGPATLDGTGEQSINEKPAMKAFWEISSQEAKACLDATTWHAGMTEYFRGGGWSTKYTSKADMPVTMSRINLIKGLGAVLQIAEGYTIELPASVHELIDERTNPTWPTTWFVPNTTGQGVFKDVYSVMANWGSNHGAISYGHIGADLITLASMLRIPVYMHNVDEEKVFRPHAWAAFGTNDLESADFRACKAYGPNYGKSKH